MTLIKTAFIQKIRNPEAGLLYAYLTMISQETGAAIKRKDAIDMAQMRLNISKNKARKLLDYLFGLGVDMNELIVD